jgi:hypothetical protein
MLRSVAAAAFLVSVLPSTASAQQPDRFTLERTPNGYVRMDRQTGEMSICQDNAGQLVCKPATEESSAPQDKIDRLETKLSDIEKRIATLERGSIIKPEAVLPSEEQFEKSLGYMERFFRRFMDIVRDFERDWRWDQQETEPQRT